MDVSDGEKGFFSYFFGETTGPANTLAPIPNLVTNSNKQSTFEVTLMLRIRHAASAMDTCEPIF